MRPSFPCTSFRRTAIIKHRAARVTQWSSHSHIPYACSCPALFINMLMHQAHLLPFLCSRLTCERGSMSSPPPHIQASIQLYCCCTTGCYCWRRRIEAYFSARPSTLGLDITRQIIKNGPHSLFCPLRLMSSSHQYSSTFFFFSPRSVLSCPASHQTLVNQQSGQRD